MIDKKIMTHNLRLIENHPYEGILYCDSSTLFTNAECLNAMVDALYEQYKDKGITKVVGSEAKGFVVGSLLAGRLNAGFVMARIGGMLPYDTISETYEKNGTRCLEIHEDAIREDDVVLLHDDILCTGVTMGAIYRLVKRRGVKQTYICFLIELGDHNGREALPKEVEITSLLRVF